MVEQDLTVKRQEYGLFLHTLNLAARVLRSLGLAGSFDEDVILATAKRRSGMQEFDDYDFWPAFREILRHVEAAPLTHFGRINAQQGLIKGITNRLEINAYLKNHPEVLDYPLKRPIFILGFPRTGTTLIQNLMGLSPGRRTMQLWELISPVPVHADPRRDEARRIRGAQALLTMAYLIAPEMKYVHQIGATTAEECWPLFFNTFSVMNYDLQANLRAYGDWLMTTDMVPPYRDYRTQLQILAQRSPEDSLILKCPEHLWFLDSLLEVFPDACIVWTHRDPLASIASYCSLISLNHRMLFGRIDQHAIGANITDRFQIGVERAMAARERHQNEAQFFDVDFVDLVTNPTDMVRQIHAHFNLPYADTMDTDVQTWLNNDRADKKGRHRYSASVYGLDAEHIDKKYASYVERFQIPCKR